MQQGKKVSGVCPLSWQIVFDIGVIIPSKSRIFENCDIDISCEDCESQNKQVEEFEAKLNKLQRKLSNFHVTYFCWMNDDEKYSITWP